MRVSVLLLGDGAIVCASLSVVVVAERDMVVCIKSWVKSPVGRIYNTSKMHVDWGDRATEQAKRDTRPRIVVLVCNFSLVYMQ